MVFEMSAAACLLGTVALNQTRKLRRSRWSTSGNLFYELIDVMADVVRDLK
jgi:hypothetical protein